MTKKTAFTLVLMAVLLILPRAGLFAQEPQTVRVPEGNGKPILTDGIFSPGEWDDALKIPIRPNVELLLKKSAGFVFVGIRYIPFTLSVVDLFISPDGKAIRHLHVSAQLGERLLNDTPGTDDDPEFIWGDTTGWYANEIRWNERKVQAMIKEGKDSGQAQEASLYKYDGFEFQIRQSKFGSNEWLVRLETPTAPNWAKPVVFPEGTDTVSTRGWLKLVFK
ncbi:MAG: hypothetical protein MUQ25_09345 [Candidatus Aminicenantes bacterium]|nr:hypothetical protein [Candidatus Aminicenantes bacterium]MCJ7486352.1 hypothetical protein [Candidatus Aminicenantes bacterium]